MSFATVINYIASNLGFALLEDLILVITFFSCIVLFARDFKIGLLILFMLFSTEFIMFSLLGMQVAHVLILMVISLIALTLSLFLTRGVGIN